MNARQCYTRDGIPKLAFATFDEAHDAAMRTTSHNFSNRVHAYRCPEHGWHIGHNLVHAPPTDLRRSA